MDVCIVEFAVTFKELKVETFGSDELFPSRLGFNMNVSRISPNIGFVVAKAANSDRGGLDKSFQSKTSSLDLHMFATNPQHSHDELEILPPARMGCTSGYCLSDDVSSAAVTLKSYFALPMGAGI
ncbi:uncharacterized protein CIMG_10077 [Coccidioides immitis RS]|uniref:Uncharacterized protein n=2 Tax=Coccidioides immitis TaxID=5501 RepID=J3K0S2_COCIM|nr:uncharacterized protein CIMG_10077 [Coccidioides immitis RS]EAS27472.3 hypothetical protein CIMG_10077 [Coccidioides immitis RS]KMP09430.1 hypothetical protein CIRG_09600 [Coccidioides immitis RMSCC 2394]